MTDYIKTEEGVLDYEFDWSGFLEAGETISSSTVTVSDGITKVSDAINTGAESVTVWLSGGLLGRTYTIKNVITTTESRTDSRVFTVTIRDISP